MTFVLRLLACFAAHASLALAGGLDAAHPAQLARLDRALAPSHAQYDPAEQMLRRPFSSPGYHTQR